jgi:C1A family cysteine protease/peptidoglycan hydrolase-like protein with peptidoglycan-binding domain
VAKKSTGWVPDYPDFRDYRLDEIEQKLTITVQDIQQINDDDSQSSIEELFELLNSIKNSIKNGLKKPLQEALDHSFENFGQKISKGFKLVNAKAIKEQIFLDHGCAGQEVYNIQRKLLKLINYEDRFGNFTKDIKKLKEDFDNSDYIEYGYFGKNTKEAVKLFKKIFGISLVSDDSVVDQVTLYTLNQVLEVLENENPETKINSQDEVKKLGMFDEEIKNIQIKLTTLDYLNNLGKNNGAIQGFFDYLTQDAVREFQKQNYLKVDGIVDDKTNKTLESVDKNYNNQQKKAYGDEKVKTLQKLLRDLGEFDGQVTGYCGLQTKIAIKSFQAKYGLVVDGLVDSPKTLEVLNYLVLLKKQQKLVLPASSSIHISLYEIILRVFEIVEFQPKDFVSEKGFQVVTDSDKSDISQHHSVLKRSIDMMVKLVAQLISPLAQHRNLEKAVRDALEKLDQYFNKSEYVNCIRKNNIEPSRRMRYTTISFAKSNSYTVNKKSFQQDFLGKSSTFSPEENQKNLFKDWDFNPLSLYIALSTILNLKLSLKNIKETSDKEGTKRITTSFNKIDNIFKSLKNLEVSLKSYNPPLQEEDNSKNQHKNLTTVIQILLKEEDEQNELQKSLEFQSDLKLLVQDNLQECMIPKEKKGKDGSIVYLLMPEFVDLSFWCSPVEDQGSLNSCTAHAGVALMEYFEKRSFDRYVDASRLFLYKATRNLMHRQRDTGASLRQTMKAMALFGVPPEEYWPYTEEEDKFDEEPTPFCYSFGQNYKALKYFRLNPLGTTEEILLFRIKTALASGFPCAFGFTMYYSIEDLNPSGHIPYPVKNDKVKGGHAVVAVGYDDHKVIENADGSQRSQGALLIRNSWGTDWGEGGYGWLPYDYVLKGLTNDWWSLVKSKWFETGHFGLGANDWVSNLGTQDRDGTSKENREHPNFA